MNVFPSINQFKSNPAYDAILHVLKSNEQAMGLQDAVLYHAFPLYRDDEGGLIAADCVLLSQNHGVIPFALAKDRDNLSQESERRCLEIAEQVPSFIQSRLIKNRALRKGPTRLAFEIQPVAFAPFLSTKPKFEYLPIALTERELLDYFNSIRDKMSDEMFKELVATIDGAKGLIRPKKRNVSDRLDSSKGRQAEMLEASIMLFDQQQKHGMMGRISGPQRIRGLAGSGKTVVLAMKAAQTLLHDPDAKIAYTFYTKSLYQHIKRLITRFYRQFDDRDPDWEKNIHILHAWGGTSTPGLYSVACEKNDIAPISYQQAAIKTSSSDRFDFVCNQFLKQTKAKSIYDYIFVDEGQDFPLSFIRMCHRLAKKGRFVLAYDDLQTIFQATTPSAKEIFSTDNAGNPLAAFEEDIVLHKCYRNPREVLLSAHALGFGIYGDRIVQMLESKDHWEDVGYNVKRGNFTEGDEIIVERPRENSLTIISDAVPVDEIIKQGKYQTPEDEVNDAANSIAKDIQDGLQPDDILVITVDDRFAKRYLTTIESKLFDKGIQCNNMHGDSFGIRDFSMSGRVTLSTVHKAKGNEAFMVYVLGVDALMHYPDVRKRNMLFTAMTRAKGWVRVSGVGEGADRFVTELAQAKANFPNLKFRFPSSKELKMMRRDLAEAADKKLRTRRLIEQLQEELSPEEIAEAVKQLDAEGQRSKRKPGWGGAQ